MNAQPAMAQRRYELDWLRVLAILGFGMKHLFFLFGMKPKQRGPTDVRSVLAEQGV